MSFKVYLDEKDYQEFNEALDLIINSDGLINEGILEVLSDKVKAGIGFIKNLGTYLKVNFVDLLKLFKEKIIFSFFTKIKWSISKLCSIVKDGYNLYKDLIDVIAEYISKNDIVKWTTQNLKNLDDYLKSHPLAKRASGLVIAGLLIYVWVNMISFIGDVDFDFDQSSILGALSGDYTLEDLFGSTNGVKMLMFIGMNALTGVSFPWPGSTWVLFTISILYTVSRKYYPTVTKELIKNINHIKGV